MQPDYQEETQRNEAVFRDVARSVRPDVFSLMDALDTYSVNYLVLLKVITHLWKIANGSKFGNVVIEVQNGVCTFVRGEESDRLNEAVLKLPS